MKAQFSRRERGREDEPKRWGECEEEEAEKTLERKIEKKSQLERGRTGKRKVVETPVLHSITLCWGRSNSPWS